MSAVSSRRINAQDEIFFRSGHARNFRANQRLGRACDGRSGRAVMEVRMTKAVPRELAETDGLMAGRTAVRCNGDWLSRFERVTVVTNYIIAPAVNLLSKIVTFLCFSVFYFAKLKKNTLSK